MRENDLNEEAEPVSTQSPENTPTTGSVVLEGVSKRYGDNLVVDNLSLDIAPGEFISLLGPSGCGKTTTLRMIAGFEYPDAGDIRINAKSVLGLAPYKRDVNTVFQAYALFPHMTVAENVAFGLQERRVPKVEIRERVADALGMVQMRSFADRKPTQLSGGQQQRIALARALVNRPSVVLLDEPLGALDRQLREQMQLELKLIQAQLGITFIFVTHDQGEALSMSDRIAVMRDGKIEQLADSDTIYAKPVSAYVAGFVGQQNFFDGRLTAQGVETAYGVLSPAEPVTSVSVGSEARAAVRPEFMTIETTDPGTTVNAMQARVIGSSHLGEIMQFLVQLGSEQSVIVHIPTPIAPRLNINDTVWLRWSAASVQVFPTDDAATAAGFVEPPTTGTVRSVRA